MSHYIISYQYYTGKIKSNQKFSEVNNNVTIYERISFPILINKTHMLFFGKKKTKKAAPAAVLSFIGLISTRSV